MRTTTLGRGGPVVSRAGLGLMGMSSVYGPADGDAPAKPDVVRAQSSRKFRRAVSMDIAVVMYRIQPVEYPKYLSRSLAA